MRKKFGVNCMIIGVLLIVAALSLMIYNYCADKQASQSAENIIPKLKLSVTESEESKNNSYKENKTDSPAKSNYDSYEMKIVELDSYNYVGYLTIPALGLELPVMAECDYDRLQISPCRYYGSVKTDDMVIAAHNYTGHFGRLTQLKIDDPIIFTDMDGNVYNYKVGSTEKLAPTATAEMIQSDWDLTLYTCNYSGASRITIRCRKA